MIAIMLAGLLQTGPVLQEPPALTATDLCVEMQGRGLVTIGDRRLRGRVLSRAVTERLPAGRPLFIRFANDRAQSDVEGMTAIMAGASRATSIVIVESCELPAGNNPQ